MVIESGCYLAFLKSRVSEGCFVHSKIDSNVFEVRLLGRVVYNNAPQD